MRRDIVRDDPYALLESLLIEVLRDHYEETGRADIARALGRQHAIVFRLLLGDRHEEALAARSAILERCDDLSISPGIVCAAEAKAFLEILRFQRGRFRLSPRVLETQLVFLRQAISVIRPRSEPKPVSHAA